MTERDTESGTTVGGFVLGRRLGVGGFGAVYAAQDRDGQEVAVKISHPGSVRLSVAEIGRRQAGIEALARLRHPCLAKVHGYGLTAEGRLYLATELVEGVGLGQYLAERRRLQSTEAIQIMRRVADAVAYCHALDILHLDLRPENIVLTEPHEPRLKVLHFGLAQLASEPPSVPPAGPAQPHAYRAPECFLPDASNPPDSRHDLYALGAILYQLLTGRLPLEAASAPELAQLKVTADPRPVRDLVRKVPEPLAALVHSLLARDPCVRLGGAGFLSMRLKELYYSILARASAAGEHPLAVTSTLPAVAEEVPFVGRKGEMSILRGEIADVVAGAGRVVVIVADPGLGKSRLVAETLHGESRAITITGRYRQQGELVPYAPLREALGQLAAVIKGGPRAPALDEVLNAEAVVLGSLAPEFCELAVAAAETSRSATDLAPFRRAGADRVAPAMARVLSSLPAPVVMVLEDIHWADEGTLAVIATLLKGELPGRVLLLCTCRPPGKLADSPPLRVMRLEPLTPTENDALLAALVGTETLPATLKDWIPFLAAGNPLFNTQVVRDLELEGYVRREPGGSARLDSQRGGLDAYRPPDSVTTVLDRAVRRLQPTLMAVLGAAALMGRQFSVTDLRTLGAFSAAEVDEAVGAAVRQGLCRISGDLCSFAHDTVREQLESTVPPPRLPELHRLIARQLERRGVPAGTLGRHLEQAGEDQAAGEAFFQAGLEAEKLHDPRGAHRHLERAFRLQSTLPAGTTRDAMLARTVFELVRVGCALGDTGETMALLDRCESLLAARTPEHGALLDSSYARLAYVQGDLPRAMEFGARCLAAVKETPALRRSACFPANVVGRARCISGRFGDAVRLLQRGCELAREIGEYSELSHSAGLLGASHAFCGDYGAAARHADICMDFARRLGDPLRIMGALVYRSAVSEARFDWEQGVKDTTELLTFAEENSIGGLYLYVGATMAGRHQFHVGNLARARVLLGNALQMSLRLKMASLRSWVYAFLADVYFALGQRHEAAALYRSGIEGARLIKGDDFAEPLCLAGLAYIAALSGSGGADEILASIDEAVTRLEVASNRATSVLVLERAAEALEAIGEREQSAARRAQRAALIERLGVRDRGASAAPAPDRPPPSRTRLEQDMGTVEGFIPPF
jgi:eukaryotic-like serine/threonine-protein kinase